MQIRFQFKRGNDLKFIGHLDIMRLFERSFKRSGLQIVHSQGFNPRPQLVFGQPMPLGLTSDGEFADVELADSYDPQDFVRIMNGSLPPGIQLVEAKVKKGSSNLMALIAGARYHICFDVPESIEIHRIIEEALKTDTMLVMKKTKSGVKEKNIRPLIYEMTGDRDGVTGYFDVLVGAGQEDNVRPELFLAGVSGICNVNLEMGSMHRLMLYGRKENQWLSLLDDDML